MSFSDWTEGASNALRKTQTFASDLVRPTIRLGVTGLARSGKTVFITALIHNLIHGGRLPFFRAMAGQKLLRAYLEPQPDDHLPRFDYEKHIADLSRDPPQWPESTSRIQQLRLTLEYEPKGFLSRRLGPSRLSIDIVDYPGEWLLDLPLLGLSYEEWSGRALSLARMTERRDLSSPWLALLDQIDSTAPQNEQAASEVAEQFKTYLRNSKADERALSIVPPGRFLMPGDLGGSPALTFSPLKLPHQGRAPHGSQWALMARRFEAYKTHVVQPFFQEHFVRLDRQIVLVDALSALNAGPSALRDLENTLTEILMCFRPGSNSWLRSIWRKRIDHILFAATKADHLHHSSHDRFEAILERITEKAQNRAKFAGAEVKVLALAAIRATHEAEASNGGEALPCILGTPLPGERLGEQVFDGREEVAVFPGDLPLNPDEALAEGRPPPKLGEEDMRFIRFMPPSFTLSNPDGTSLMPHIRLDHAIEFLIGDRLA